MNAFISSYLRGCLHGLLYVVLTMGLGAWIYGYV